MEAKDKLLKDHKRLIASESAKYAKFVPYHVVEAEAYRLANAAADSYDDSRGIKFSTHLVNSLKKLSRISTKYGGILRVPENKQFKIQRLNQAEEELRGEFGRDATLDELARATGFNLAEITGLKQSRKRDVNVANLPFAPMLVEDVNDEWVHIVYHDLTQRDRFILEHKTGFGGKTVMSTEEIAKALGISPSTVANRVKIISDKLAEGWK